MAYYAALVSLVQLLEDVLHRNLYSNFLQRGIVESLHQKFIGLEKELQDYPCRSSEANEDVEIQIRDVACQAQDIIECNIIDLEKQTHVVVKNFYQVILACQKAFCLQPGLEECDEVLLKLGQEVYLITQQLVAIKESQRSAEDSHMNCYAAGGNNYQEQAPGINDAVVGLDKYLTTVKDQLCGHSSQLEAISIVGMGGIGKTTLARSVYGDGLIQYYFDCHAWVTISQDYHIGAVLHSIAQSLGVEMDDVKKDETHGGEDEEQKIKQLLGDLKERIYKHLIGRRYMIMLDDVWHTDVLVDLKHVFPNDKNGSRILLTTRLDDVADYCMNTAGFALTMSLLDENQSWDLLRRKVFANEQCPPDLEDIGKNIASKCHGLPLAIVVIAGILSNVRTLTPLSWEKVAENVHTTLHRSDDEHLSNILSSSYNYLPHQLKPCFLYMGMFPEDYEFSIRKLIELWMAEGLLKPANGPKTLEQMGEECVVNLVQRNLVIITQKRANGQFKSCIVHDVLREFCRKRAFKENFFHVGHYRGRYLDPKDVKIIRRICLHDSSPRKLIPHEAAKLVRSILCCSHRPTNPVREFFTTRNEDPNISNWDSYKLLRVLDAQSEQGPKIWQNSCNMPHLRYLGFVYTGSWILKFHSMHHNLQTLVVDYRYIGGLKLPSGIWACTRLRHLLVKGKGMELPPTDLVDHSSPGQILGNLQTVLVVLGFIFTDEAIRRLPNLRKLKVRNTINEFTSHWEDYCLHNLSRLHLLEELKIHFHVDPHFIGYSSYMETFSPRNFVFPSNLRKLSLHGCRLPWREMSVVGSLPLLQVLRLQNQSFVGELWEPVEGEFLKLKFLLMRGLHLCYWLAETSHFQCLEQLEIDYCPLLKEIPLQLGDIPTLRLIYITGSEQAKDSAIRILEEQQDLGNDELQVHFSRRKKNL